MNLALYIHYPFCLRKCLYCAFNSVSDGVCTPGDYVAALLGEMELVAREWEGPGPSGTLYFGGGTPSLIPPAQIERIKGAAAELFGLAEDAEVTLECNPGTVNREWLKDYRAAGINRLSMGVQSFDDSLLAGLGRVHTSGEAREALALAREAGFQNLGIDLIHSLPGQTPDMWERELLRARAFSPEHVSVYGLTIEEGTPFFRMEKEGLLAFPDEDDYVRMFELAGEILPASGYEQYEISNFARPGFRSRHNSGYWERIPCLGFGAGAHSFTPERGYGIRYANPDKVEEYLEAIRCGRLPRLEQRVLSREEAMAEHMFLGLRRIEGVNLPSFGEEFGSSFQEVFGAACADLFRAGVLEIRGDCLRLTRRGLLLSNQVFARFL